MQSNIFHTAILSYGMSGRVFHAPFLATHPGFHLVGCWERSQKNIQSRYPEVISYNSLEEVLTNDQIQLVVVNTPIATHFDYTLKCLEAGKHVLVEKCFTRTAEEAILLKAAMEKAGKQLFVFQNRRWDSDFLTVKKVKESGVLGELVEAEFHYDRFDGNLSYKAHKEIAGVGVGVVTDLGPHIIDQAISLFGMPERVFADLRKTRKNTQVDDYFEILLYYPNLRVRLKAGYFVKLPVPSFQLHGKQGSFLKNRSDRQEADLQLAILPNSPNWGQDSEQDFGQIWIDGEDKPRAIPSETGNYMAFFENVYQTLLGNEKPAVSVEDGIRSMRIVDAAYESNRQQAIILLSY
ncbi:Gfo/Idh/MocA family oxidoreductase [Aquirufa ecclesiirivi]